MVGTLVGAFAGILLNTGRKTFWTTMAVMAVLIGIAAIVAYQAQGSDYLPLGALVGFQVLKSGPAGEVQSESRSS